jgi:hypothetical protein
MMQQRGNMRPANGMRPSDIAYLPLSDSAAKMQIYATYDSAAGAITKIRATGDYQFCTAAEGGLGAGEVLAAVVECLHEHMHVLCADSSPACCADSSPACCADSSPAGCVDSSPAGCAAASCDVKMHVQLCACRFAFPCMLIGKQLPLRNVCPQHVTALGQPKRSHNSSSSNSSIHLNLWHMSVPTFNAAVVCTATDPATALSVLLCHTYSKPLSHSCLHLAAAALSTLPLHPHQTITYAGDTQCAPAAACTGSFATDSPCTIYGGLGPCGVAVKGARRGGVTPAGGFSIRLDMRANEVGMCPRRRAAARRLMQTPVLMTIQMQSNDNEMEDDQNTNYDDPDPTEQKPMDDEEDTPVVTPPVTTTVTPVMMPATPIKPVAMPTQIPTTPTMIPTSTINKPIITTNVPITTTTNVPITTTSSNDDMEPDQTVTNDGQDPTGLQQDDGMDDGDNSPMVTDDQDYTDYDVPLTTTGGGSGGGGGGGRGNSKSKLMFYGGACEVALLIKNAGTSNCYCFTGVTSARVGRRAPRMASGNGGSQRGPVYKRWKCKDLVPKTGAACTCEA